MYRRQQFPAKNTVFKTLGHFRQPLYFIKSNYMNFLSWIIINNKKMHAVPIIGSEQSGTVYTKKSVST